MDEYPTINRLGVTDSVMAVHGLELFQIGHYQAYWEPKDDEGDTGFYVLCPPEMRKDYCWNYTFFGLTSDGNLEPNDNDVELDPYHMNLLYQLLEEVTRGV